MKLEPGTMVTPNVRLVSVLGTGAMGSVWVADHLTLNTRVAVKFISERLDPDNPEVMKRFRREAATAAQIKSSHVVQTFDQGVMEDGTPYIVMELLDGEGLGKRLAREGRLELRQMATIVWQTTKALGSAHKLGIVHRDIKPDNIFLSTRDDELHVKVFDFGIAKHTWQRADAPASVRPPPGAAAGAEVGITNDGVMLGTPEYMSPEQVLDAKHVDHFADLWALAVVAYQCVTGRLPFVAEEIGELCVKLLEASFEPASHHCAEVPEALDNWFDKSLHKDQRQRFSDARELGQGLMAALGVPPSLDLRQSGRSEALPLSSTSLHGPGGAGGGVPLGATFSGAAADARGAGGRRRHAVVLAAVLGAVAAAGLTAAWLGGDSAPGSTESAAGQVAASTEPLVGATAPPAAAGDAPVAPSLDPPAPASGVGGEEAPASMAASSADAGPRAATTPVKRPAVRPRWRRHKDPGF